MNFIPVKPRNQFSPESLPFSLFICNPDRLDNAVNILRAVFSVANKLVFAIDVRLPFLKLRYMRRARVDVVFLPFFPVNRIINKSFHAGILERLTFHHHASRSMILVSNGPGDAS
ncbi:MAG: hypothetical protein ABIK07_01450 [Planctomycetota bacterium]